MKEKYLDDYEKELMEALETESIQSVKNIKTEAKYESYLIC